MHGVVRGIAQWSEHHAAAQTRGLGFDSQCLIQPTYFPLFTELDDVYECSIDSTGGHGCMLSLHGAL